MTIYRILRSLCIMLCLSASLAAQTINWQSANGNTTTTDKVGIGTTTAPGSILELSAAAPIQTIRYTDPANYGCLYFYEAANPVGVVQYVGSNYATPTYRNALMFINWAAGPNIFFTGAVERMRVDAAGNVGIGTTNPNFRLQVTADGTGTWPADNGSGQFVLTGATDTTKRMGFMIDTTNNVGVIAAEHYQIAPYNLALQPGGGNVGIGLTNPSEKLSVAGTIQTSGGVLFPDGLQTSAYPFSNNASDLNREVTAGLLTSSVTNRSSSGSADLAAIAGNGISYVRLASNEATPTRDWRIGMTDSTGTFKIHDNAGNADRMTISGSAITFNGNVTGTSIQATYQDLAEWVPTAERLASGTVVVVGEEADNTVTASMHAYDTSVAGVVSGNPGLLLGVGSASKAKIATTGRVRVRVDATKSSIRKGDLLVTSDRPGMAMKSEPLDLGGVKIHRPGTLIGKALEPLASGEGEILVLLSLQ